MVGLKCLMLCLTFSLVSSFSRSKQVPPTARVDEGRNVGYPSILTDFILANKLEEGRKNCSVQGIKAKVKSYSGFFRVRSDKQMESNMFFWYFPAETKPESAPVVLWLQGGPGASSLFGLFQEIGPFSARNKGLKMREYYWSKSVHLLFLDNPVGAGFSFTTAEVGYARNQSDVARDAHNALLQFFTLFPDLQARDFFISGESYAGKFVPAIAMKIDKSKQGLKINLKGITIGNGFCDPVNMMQYSDYLYQIGLLDIKGKNTFSDREKEITDLIKKNSYTEAYNKFNTILNGDGLSKTLFTNLTHSVNYFDYRNFTSDSTQDNYLIKYIDSDVARRFIHVGDKTFNLVNIKVEQYLQNDFMKSVRPDIEYLLSKYKVLIYNGQFDIIVAYPLTENFVRNLQWSGAAQFKAAERRPLLFGGEIAGYYKNVKNLYQVMVRNAGHMVPMDQPRNALNLITRFVFGKPISD
ncbi:venom serine carboxypeptidase-like [Nilaparvata lugens]|uniref:venom serine carboxypeptidase-like n=1 Tax=Nilaparvata lugens TaxID=108931 RepID=UPI00193D95BD|nr:venom serine carboxypeptidase-like [Nilaparvata lugens]